MCRNLQFVGTWGVLPGVGWSVLGLLERRGTGRRFESCRADVFSNDLQFAG
ncbi:MAG: hypothetical protein WA239_08210 [Candidatus Sulfotelmatobacter sp.]